MLHRLYGGARREQGNLVGFRRRERIGVEHHRATGRRRNTVHVRDVVHAGQLFAFRGARRDDLHSRVFPAGGDLSEHAGPFRALRMAGWRRVFLETRG